MNTTNEIDIFSQSIINDDRTTISKILKNKKIDINQKNKNGESLLYVAIKNKKTWAFGLLLMNGVKIKGPVYSDSEKWKTVKECVMHHNNYPMLEIMEKFGEKINFKGIQESETLYTAIEDHNLDYIKYALKKGFDASYINKSNESLLMKMMSSDMKNSNETVEDNFWGVVYHLLQFPDQINCMNEKGQTPISIFNRYFEKLNNTNNQKELKKMVYQLLKNVDISCVYTKSLVSLITLADKLNDETDWMNILFKDKNIDEPGVDSETFLMATVRKSNVNLLEKSICQYNASLKQVNKDNENCKDIAKYLGDVDIFLKIESIEKERSKRKDKSIGY